MTHALKTWPRYFEAIVKGDKTFEVRKADRDFKVGETLLLQEFEPADNKYTGEQIEMQITYILEGGNFGIKKGYVVMGVKEKPSYA